MTRTWHWRGDIRALVSAEIVLMHDPVQQYSVEDAIRVGRQLEELVYLWIEEPLQESDTKPPRGTRTTGLCAVWSRTT